MSHSIGNLDKLLVLTCRKLFSRYKVQLYASHNQGDFYKRLQNLNSHYIDYKTNITDTGSPGVSTGTSTLYEIYVKKIDYSHAELAMNTTAHRS
ncbi:hypothetical protein [Paenibacillus sp. Marseille-Q4541]|uniref:hypothetical protein n=1 Tax=Paenibacillus sp. Marseille-Q4541 TaxID=2831522 RepID=UPI001BA906DF|nr:hypothetical protein [Paenibacillus sp. Marseille-Q4541]